MTVSRMGRGRTKIKIYTVLLQKFGVLEIKFCPFHSCPGESALKSEAGSRAAEVRLLLLKEGATLTARHSVGDS